MVRVGSVAVLWDSQANLEGGLQCDYFYDQSQCQVPNLGVLNPSSTQCNALVLCLQKVRGSTLRLRRWREREGERERERDRERERVERKRVSEREKDRERQRHRRKKETERDREPRKPWGRQTKKNLGLSPWGGLSV